MLHFFRDRHKLVSTMHTEAVVTVIAIVLGPILALWIQRGLDKWREAHKRRLDVFKSLMTYRGTRLAPAFVQALNSIDLEFKGRRDKAVLDAWKELQDHYSEWGQKTDADAAAQATTLNERALDLLSILLVTMGARLGYTFNKVYIKKGWYYPKGLSNIELEQHALRQSLLKVLSGQSHLPVAVFAREFPPLTITPEQSSIPAEIPLVRQALDEPKEKPS